jgi:hypothetical protein
VVDIHHFYSSRPVDRLSRYEASLWRQAGQILFALDDRRKPWDRRRRLTPGLRSRGTFNFELIQALLDHCSSTSNCIRLRLASQSPFTARRGFIQIGPAHQALKRRCIYIFRASIKETALARSVVVGPDGVSAESVHLL